MKNFKFFRLYVVKLFTRYVKKLILLKKTRYNDKILLSDNQTYQKRPSTIRNSFIPKIIYIIVVVTILILVFQLWRLNKTNFACPIVSEGIVGVYNFSNLPSTVTALLSEPLIILDKSGEPIEKLVEKVISENENTVYTLSLKKNLHWNDGTEVKSSDIKISLTDIEISYPDDSTIKIKLADTFTPFLTLLTSPVLKPGTLVGLGKYKVSYLDENHGFISKLVLEPIDKNKCIDNPIVNIRFYPDEQTTKTAFELGEIDAILSLQDVGNLKQQPNVIIKMVQNYSKLVAIFYNTKDPILDKNYRKALNFVTNQIKNEDFAKTSISQTSWAFNDDLKVIHGDLENAKNFLNKVEAGKDKQIILTTTPTLNQLAEKIIQDWKSLGVDAVVRVESGMPQNFQTLLTTVPIPHDPDQYALWHSTQTKTNLSKYSSPRVDKDLEDGRKISDKEIRIEKYWDFQKILNDDVPATFLYFPKINVVYRQKIENNFNKILNLQLI